MKIAKEFRWEMGHRLPYHEGLCKNLHGHSYKMIVEISGNVSENGMIIDFFELKRIVKPIIDKLDHAFLVWENDENVLNFLKQNSFKTVVFHKHSTVENISEYLSDLIFDEFKHLKNSNITDFTVKVSETPNSYAEINKKLNGKD